MYRSNPKPPSMKQMTHESDQEIQMVFDKAKVLEQIQTTLSEIPLPGTPGNTVQPGLI